MSDTRQSAEVRSELERFMAGLVRRNPGETEFHQAVREVAESVLPYTLRHVDRSLEGLRCAVSGSGNVAIYSAEKLIQLGAKPISLSDSGGAIHDPDGIDEEKLAWVKELKEVRRGRIREYAEKYGVDYLDGGKPWELPCEAAFPCATQNELDEEDAAALVDSGCQVVAEGANMPCTAGAVARLRDAGVLFGPAKAANAGGVAVSGLEQSQNALRISWSREEVDERLQGIMRRIHEQCVQAVGRGDGPIGDGPVSYVDGANIAGFKKVADAMLSYGVV